MKYLLTSNKWFLALLGTGFLLFGGVSLLRSGDGAAPQVFWSTVDGSSLGIEMEDVTADSVPKFKLSGETGVIVRSVVKGSPAEAAQLQENDVILEYAGIPVFSTFQFSRMVADTPVGRTVDLTVSRDGRKLNLKVKLAERRGSTPAASLELLPRNLRRQFEVIRPGTGAFQFSVPNERGLAFSVTRAGRPELGATVETLTDQMADFLAVPGKKGVLVTTVREDSPAASKLKAGDVITAIDGKTVAGPSELAQAVARKEPGSVAELKIIREKKETTVTVELPKSNVSRRGIKV